jgi:hypothetical protein
VEAGRRMVGCGLEAEPKLEGGGSEARLIPDDGETGRGGCGPGRARGVMEAGRGGTEAERRRYGGGTDSGGRRNGGGTEAGQRRVGGGSEAGRRQVGHGTEWGRSRDRGRP